MYESGKVFMRSFGFLLYIREILLRFIDYDIL